jgi:hypothetical protein
MAMVTTSIVAIGETKQPLIREPIALIGYVKDGMISTATSKVCRLLYKMDTFGKEFFQLLVSPPIGVSDEINGMI